MFPGSVGFFFKNIQRKLKWANHQVVFFNGCLSYHRDQTSTSHTTIPIFRLVNIFVCSKNLPTLPRSKISGHVP